MAEAPAILILPGPPGAGKGAQARRLDADFGLVQLSTGDLRRAAAAVGTDAGKAAKAVMGTGHLVSDDFVLAIQKDCVATAVMQKGVILDGFPRMSGQATALDSLLAKAGRNVSAAISLEVDDAAMVARVAGRTSCAGCGDGDHDEFKQPLKAGVCDKCGGTAFRRRADDTAETVRERLTAYHARTAPLIAHHEVQSVLERVPAMGSIDRIRTVPAGIVGRVSI